MLLKLKAAKHIKLIVYVVKCKNNKIKVIVYFVKFKKEVLLCLVHLKTMLV